MTETVRMGLPPRAIDPAVMRQAAEWMAQLWSEEASEQDLAECLRWRAGHPDHEQAWQRLAAVGDKLGSVPREAARHALHKPVANGRRRALRVLGFGGLALGAGYATRETGVWQHATADYHSGLGEVLPFTLPDGSRLVLGPGTAVDVHFTGSERLLVLQAGEILITTAPDSVVPSRPLRVRTRHGTVQALGTRFSVRDEGEESWLAVFEGAVEIRPAGNAGVVVRVDAGLASRFSRQEVTTPVPVSETAVAWSQGLLVANDMRLDALVAELGRYRRGLLRCDPEVAGLRVSGVFSLRDTDRALHNLCLALPVQVRYRTRYWVTVAAVGGGA